MVGGEGERSCHFVIQSVVFCTLDEKMICKSISRGCGVASYSGDGVLIKLLWWCYKQMQASVLTRLLRRQKKSIAIYASN